MLVMGIAVVDAREEMGITLTVRVELAVSTSEQSSEGLE